MNVIYYSNVYLNLNKQPGVMKKISCQIKVLENAGLTVYHACPYDNEKFVIVDKNKKILSTRDIRGLRDVRKDLASNECVENFILDNNVNALYVRNGNFSLLMQRFYKKMKNRNISVILEIPTYPLTQRITNIKQCLRLRDYKTALSYLYHMTLGSIGIPLMKYSLSKIVTYNGFDAIWGVETLKIPNAVDVNSMPPHLIRKLRNNELHLIAVANVAKWHGYDRIIKSMYDFNKSNKKGIAIFFDIIGPGSEVLELKKLVKELGLEERVFFRGLVLGEELNYYFDHADVAVSVLGCHRDGMNYYDSLKSREYSARCIPFITTCAERDYVDLDFVYSVPNDESLIDMNNVIDFYDKICEGNTTERMRQFALEKCDWSKAFKPVCDYIKRSNEEGL
jgi:glycosyltransferase involved in cell wall biosynthesis